MKQPESKLAALITANRNQILKEYTDTKKLMQESVRLPDVRVEHTKRPVPKNIKRRNK